MLKGVCKRGHKIEGRNAYENGYGCKECRMCKYARRKVNTILKRIYKDKLVERILLEKLVWRLRLWDGQQGKDQSGKGVNVGMN